MLQTLTDAPNLPLVIGIPVLGMVIVAGVVTGVFLLLNRVRPG